MRSILREVHFLRSRPTMGGAEWNGMERGDKKRKGKHKMSYNKLRKIYWKLSVAYSANLDAKGEPENEEVSGNLGEVMEMIDELMQRATK